MRIHVSASGPWNGNGDKALPYPTILQAVKASSEGDEILVSPGIYREDADAINHIKPLNVRIISVVPDGAVVTGAKRVNGWESFWGDVWRVRIRKTLFTRENPYILTEGEGSPMHAGSLYWGGNVLPEVDSLDLCMRAVGRNEESTSSEIKLPCWYTEEDGDSNVIYANLCGFDPNNEEIEIDTCLYLAVFDEEKAPDSEEEEEEPVGPHRVQADITLTGCENISFPFEGSLFHVQDIFVRGNVAWLRNVKDSRLIELDCEYGIYRAYDEWAVRSLQAIDVGSDINMEGLAQTIGTLLCVLSRSMSHDPEDATASITKKVNETMEPKGITMRLTPRYLKFIQDKRFISLEDVIFRVNRAPVEIVSEEVTSSDDNGIDVA